MAATPVRRTRFVCISDTHNQTPKLPQGDVLIHAGDLTNQGSYTELKKTVQWLESANFERKIVIAGNHDVTLDKPWFAENHQNFRYDTPQDPDECLSLLTESPTITYLAHESTTVRLQAPAGPQTTFKVFGSPYSPALGKWAFGYEGDAEAERLWSNIPLDADIVVTHTPPWGYCDTVPPSSRGGCNELLHALWSVRPKLAVCGHRHLGRGVRRVLWTPQAPSLADSQPDEHPWVDPGAGKGNKKESRIDLSSRSPQPLRNTNDAAPEETTNVCLATQPHTLAWQSEGAGADLSFQPIVQPLSQPALRTAPSDRSQRLETCIVNASFMASNYGAHKEFNKPVVVDLDLPVWQGADIA